MEQKPGCSTSKTTMNELKDTNMKKGMEFYYLTIYFTVTCLF